MTLVELQMEDQLHLISCSYLMEKQDSEHLEMPTKTLDADKIYKSIFEYAQQTVRNIAGPAT